MKIKCDRCNHKLKWNGVRWVHENAYRSCGEGHGPKLIPKKVPYGMMKIYYVIKWD